MRWGAPVLVAAALCGCSAEPDPVAPVAGPMTLDCGKGFEALTKAIDDEDQMHAATAVSGSAPAYLYAFVEALEAAGAAAGLSAASAQRLARATISGAAALLAESGEEPAELRRQVTSPGGTTQAALEVLMGSQGLGPLLETAVAAAARRSRELGQ